MFELIFLFTISRYVKREANSKGRSSVGYIVATLALWLVTQLVAGFVGSIILAILQIESTLALYLFMLPAVVLILTLWDRLVIKKIKPAPGFKVAS